MMVLFLVVIIIGLVLGIIGVLADGLLYLLVIGIIVLIADVVVLAVRTARSRRPLR